MALLNVFRSVSRNGIFVKQLQDKGVVICWFNGPANGYHGRSKIGKREVVGFGLNGEYSYLDRMDYPCPAIRFREVGPELAKIKDKESGDWKQLTLDEKKTLYRASFCRTFAELQAPTGEWKSITSMVLVMIASSLWVYVLLKKFVYPPMPESTSPEWKEKQLKYLIDLRIDPIEGLASKWDYEKNRWKE